MKKIALLLVLTATTLIPAGENYSFHLLSDLHLGSAPTYHPTRFKGDVNRADLAVPGYRKMFAHMVKSVPDAKFVIQLGDMVEGNTKGRDAHAQQLREAIELLKKSFPYPVYHTMGNHEPHGLEAEQAVRDVLIPEIAGSINQKLSKFVNYSFFYKGDLFIFADYRKAAKRDKYILDTLKNLKQKPRYIFIATHIPVILLTPTRLADALARYNAIVLSGHIHQNYTIQYTKNGKTMTQITVSTRLPAKNPDKQRCVLKSTDKKMFREFIESQAKKFKKPAFMEYYTKEWEPGITSFSSCRGNGFATLHVSDEGISLRRQGSYTAQKPVISTILKK